MAPRPPTVVASRETRDAPRKRWHPSIPKEDVMRLVASLVIALLMLAAAPLESLEENKVPLLFPFQGSPITRGKKYVFSGMTLYDRQSKMMIDYLVGQRKFKTFGVLYQDDDYGKAFLTAYEKDLARHNLKIAAAEPVKRGVTDVSAQIAKLRAASPQVTFLVLTPGPGAQDAPSRARRSSARSRTSRTSTAASCRRSPSAPTTRRRSRASGCAWRRGASSR